MAFVNEEMDGGGWQTIDRQRNIILKRTGSYFPDGTPSFILNVDGHVIRFEAFRVTENLPNKKINVTWDIRSLDLFPAFNKNPEKACELITEALKTYGFAPTVVLGDHVDVKFSCPVPQKSDDFA